MAAVMLKVLIYF